MNYPKLSEPRRLRGRELRLHLIDQQRRWIEYCEKNGRSYAGPNGQAIRNADLEALRKLENNYETAY
jgi:hypothetical protein